MKSLYNEDGIDEAAWDKAMSPKKASRKRQATPVTRTETVTSRMLRGYGRQLGELTAKARAAADEAKALDRDAFVVAYVASTLASLQRELQAIAEAFEAL